MIDFKTIDEQIEIQKNRGLIFSDEAFAKNQLILNNYYNVINAYKDLYVIKNGQPDEHYKPDVTFENLYDTYLFDTQLKEIFLRNILKIEKAVKSAIAHIFAKNHVGDDYIDIQNFKNYVDKNGKFSTKTVVQLFKDRLNEKVKQNNKMICHYHYKYQHVPIWVFVNVLTLGEITKLFTVMKDADQDDVSLLLSTATKNQINTSELKRFLNELTMVRNICAHNGRMYDYSSYINIDTNNFVYQNLPTMKRPKGIFKLLITIRSLLPKNEFDNMIVYELFPLIKNLSKISSLNDKTILKKMNLPEWWIMIYNI